MTYEYAILSKAGFLLKGRLRLPEGLTTDQATHKVAQYGARIAELMKVEWDPFNVRIAITPKKRKPPRRVPNK